jgi:hypothetical protein
LGPSWARSQQPSQSQRTPIPAELFPTRARATGFALADGIGHLGGAVVPFVVYLVFNPLKPLSTGVNMFILLGVFEIIATLIVLTGPRTTKLRLEQVSG